LVPTDPIHTSSSGHIGGHQIVRELGYVEVHAKDWAPARSAAPTIRFITLFQNRAMAIDALKHEARKMGANGLVNVKAGDVETASATAVVVESLRGGRTRGRRSDRSQEGGRGGTFLDDLRAQVASAKSSGRTPMSVHISEADELRLLAEVPIEAWGKHSAVVAVDGLRGLKSLLGIPVRWGAKTTCVE
jgi:hypothetical protein